MNKKILFPILIFLSLTFVIAQINPLIQFLNVNNPTNYATPNPASSTGYTIDCQQWRSDLIGLGDHCMQIQKQCMKLASPLSTSLLEMRREQLNNNGHPNTASEAHLAALFAALAPYRQCVTQELQPCVGLLDQGYSAYNQYC
tara:strand:+ start:2546 stop:2974 length:429 start_codon:yes stop_codon:yes gene_type:complete